MLFGFFVIPELVFTLELFLADFTVKFAFMLLFMLVVVGSGFVAYDSGNIVHLILFPVVFFNLAETLLFKTLLDMLHLLLLFLFLALTLKFLLLLLLLLFPKTAQIGDETRVSLPYVGKEILDGLHIGFPFGLSLLLVLLLHLATHPSAVSVSGVPLLAPGEGFIGGEVLPVLVKLQYSILIGRGISKALVFTHVLCQVFTMGVCLGLFGLQFLEDIAVDGKEASLSILVALEAAGAEVVPDVEAEGILVEVFLAHFLLVEQQLLAVVVVEGALVGVRQHVVGLVDLDESLLGSLLRVLVGMVLEGHLAVVLSGGSGTVLISAGVALRSTSRISQQQRFISTIIIKDYQTDQYIELVTRLNRKLGAQMLEGRSRQCHWQLMLKQNSVFHRLSSALPFI